MSSSCSSLYNTAVAANTVSKINLLTVGGVVTYMASDVTLKLVVSNAGLNASLFRVVVAYSIVNYNVSTAITGSRGCLGTIDKTKALVFYDKLFVTSTAGVLTAQALVDVSLDLSKNPVLINAAPGPTDNTLNIYVAAYSLTDTVNVYGTNTMLFNKVT